VWHLNDNYRIREEKDGAGLLADISAGGVYVLNPVAMTIMTMCRDGSAQALDDIVREICRRYRKAEADVVCGHVRDFLAQVEKQGVVTDGQNQEPARQE
jgi:hypothetical protein